jgi:L-amino acid N-acyltransferase YncA
MLIRPAAASDAVAIQTIYAPAVTDSVISFEEEVPSVGEIVARMTSRPSMPWLVAEVDGEVAGYAYASLHKHRASYRWSADCSVYLAASYYRRGIGTSLYGQLFGLLRELGYLTVFAGIALPNESSVGLHERLGFTLVGVYRDVGFKHDRWLDVGWWSLPLMAHYPQQPTPPREWHSASSAT